MAHIIAARFDTFPEAEAAIHGLSGQGLARGEMSVMYVNPPGQHAAYPIGGDRQTDENARGAEESAGTGAVVGAGAGAALGAALAGVPIVGIPAAIAAVGVGAYTGSLAGSLAGAGRKESENPEPAPQHERQAGVLLAVCVGNHPERAIIAALRSRGGKDIESAEGEWRDGRWVSFNPLDPPQLIATDESIVL